MREEKVRGSRDVLDVSNQPGEHASLDNVGQLYEVLTTSSCKRYRAIVAQHNDLLSLSLSTPLAAAVQHITSLTVSHNRLTSLQGIDVFANLEFLDLSHNALRVLDVHSTSLMRKLKHLKRCDFSFNGLRMIDFDAATRGSNFQGDPAAVKEGSASPTRSSTPSTALASGAASGGIMEMFTHLDLSHNQLIEVPDLRCMPMLRELNLNYNRIDFIADLDNRLPLLALGSLSIAHNAFNVLQALLPLTVLAGGLSVLDVEGNPCLLEFGSTPSAMGVIRAWLLWLLPHLELLDGTPLTVEERHVALKLFRRGGKLSYEAVDVMNSNNSAQLMAYLKKFVHLFVSGPLVETPSMMQDGTPPSPNPVPNIVNSSVRGSTGGTEASPSVVLPPGTLSQAPDGVMQKAAGKPRSIDLVVLMLQKKVKQLSNVTEALWRESMTRRVFAAVVLQKHTRGFLTRKKLSEVAQKTCGRVRNKLQAARYRPSAIDQRSVPAMTLSSYRTTPEGNKISCGGESDISINADMIQGVSDISQLFHQIRDDLIEFREFRRHRREAAAVAIQKHYRGYSDRKQWRCLREKYMQFLDSLKNHALVAQRVGRGYLVRVRFAKDQRRALEIRKLREEVTELRDTVHEMKIMMEQYINPPRHVNPGSLMEEVITRRLISHNSRVTRSTSSTGPISASATAAVAQASATTRAASDK
uniref:Uncharacterized protein TCIL3000_11_12530 n=1 Tax=Trypanosoma congolense (strain IL3000) TaxID=1068625 RepID=G0V285_TRYCI|nr:unnamed protein product [Trypanosoma congolense IL3000]